MEVDNEPVFRVVRSYRMQLQRNPKAVIVLTTDKGNEIVNAANADRLFVGKKYEMSRRAGFLEVVHVPVPVVEASPVVTAVAATVEVHVETDVAATTEDQHASDIETKVYDESLEQPSPEIADALLRLEEDSTITASKNESSEPTVALADVEMESNTHTSTGSESNQVVPTAATDDRQIRRRRVKRG